MKKVIRPALLLFSAVSAFAQQKNSNEELMNMSLEDLMNIQIESASKKSESLFDAPFSASVLTREEIKKAGSTSIMEALRLIPGVIVREQTNGNYDIHLRGLDNVPPNSYFVYSANTTTLIMIDNRPVYNYLQGGTFWETLPIDLNDVEKIEVVRGPSSAMYGPNAVSGVIHIITRKAEKDGLNVTANAQYGSLKTLLTNASLGYRFSPKLDATISANYQDRGREVDYYLTPKNRRVNSIDSIPLSNIAGRYPHPDRSMNKYGINAFINYTPAEKIKFNLAAGTQDSEAQNTYGENGVTSLFTRVSNTQYADFKGSAYGFSGQISYLGGKQDPSTGFKGSTYHFDTYDASLEYELKYKGFSVKPGYIFRKAVYDDTQYWDASKSEGVLSGRYQIVTNAASLRSEYTFWQDKIRLFGGLRMDKFNAPDKAVWSYQGAVTIKPVANHLFRVVASKAYRSSFIYDNFINITQTSNLPTPPYPKGSTSVLKVFGDRNLALLQSKMIELGYRNKFAENLHLDLEAFYSQTENYTDVIVDKTTVQLGNPVTITTNVPIKNIPLKVRQWGGTLSVNYVSGKFQVKPFATLQKTLLLDYSMYGNTAEAAPTASNENDPAKNNLYSGMVTETVHKSTPTLFGGAFINYQVNSKININLNPYYYSSQTFSHRDNLRYKDGVRGVADINPKFLLNAKVSYSPIKSLSLFVSGRNVINDRSVEFYHDDRIGGMYLGGLSFTY